MLLSTVKRHTDAVRKLVPYHFVICLTTVPGLELGLQSWACWVKKRWICDNDFIYRSKTADGFTQKLLSFESSRMWRWPNQKILLECVLQLEIPILELGKVLLSTTTLIHRDLVDIVSAAPSAWRKKEINRVQNGIFSTIRFFRVRGHAILTKRYQLPTIQKKSLTTMYNIWLSADG